MTTLREAAQQALDALEFAPGYSMRRTDAITALRVALAASVQEPQCNPHPKAPHGFLRNASHNEHRYVCECEGWEPYEAGYQAGMEAALAEPVWVKGELPPPYVERSPIQAEPQMQPCAGRNCGSTNPNLHSAECFEDYEKATGMNKWQGLTDDEIKEIVGFWGDTPIKGYTRKLFDQIDAKHRLRRCAACTAKRRQDA